MLLFLEIGLGVYPTFGLQKVSEGCWLLFGNCGEAISFFAGARGGGPRSPVSCRSSLTMVVRATETASPVSSSLSGWSSRFWGSGCVPDYPDVTGPLLTDRRQTDRNREMEPISRWKHCLGLTIS